MNVALPSHREAHVWLGRCSGRDASSRRAAGRSALEHIVRRYAPGARLVHLEGRRPRVVGARLCVSASRSEGLVVVAVASAPGIGIDLEAVRPAPPAAVVVQLLSESEARALGQQPTGCRDVAFTRAWVRKEAVLKAVGIGLAVDPRLVEVGLEPGPPRRVHVPGHGEATVADLDLDGVVAGLAVTGTVAAQVRWFELQPSRYPPHRGPGSGRERRRRRVAAVLDGAADRLLPRGLLLDR